MKKRQRTKNTPFLQVNNYFNTENNIIKKDITINTKEPKIKKQKSISEILTELTSSDYKKTHQIIKSQKRPNQSKPHFPPQTDNNIQKKKAKKEFKLKNPTKIYTFQLENDELGYYCTYVHNQFRADTTRIGLIVNTEIDDISQYTVKIKKKITNQLLLNASLFKNEVEIENLQFIDPNIIQKDSKNYKETPHG